MVGAESVVLEGAQAQTRLARTQEALNMQALGYRVKSVDDDLNFTYELNGGCCGGDCHF